MADAIAGEVDGAEVAMNNAITTGRRLQPSTVRYRKLLSRKSHFGLKNADIAKAAGVLRGDGEQVPDGDEAIRPEIQNAITRGFETAPDRRYSSRLKRQRLRQMIGDPGLKFFIRYE